MARTDDGLGGLNDYLNSLTGKTTSTTNAAPLASPAPQTRSQAGALAGSDFTRGFSVKSVLDLGMSFLGRPYVWGGESPDVGFDCSGLVQYIYSKNGVKVPRVAHDQAGAGTAVAAKDAQPGDLILFDNNPNRPGADHVGIYLGGGKMLQAPRAGKNIEVVGVNLGKAMTIRRVAPAQPSTYAGLGGAGGRYVYDAKVTPGATTPKQITPAKGGGDPASNPTGTGVSAQAGVAPTPLGGPLPKNATPQQIKDEVARSYGYLAAFLSDKEIGPILSRAAIEDWDEARLTGALTGTKWWKTHSDTVRSWDALNRLDPAKAKSQVDQMSATLADQAEQSGLVLTGLQIHDMAVNALRFGWNGAQITDALQQQGKHDPRAKTARDFDLTLKNDPASANKMITDATADISTRAQQLGVIIDQGQAKNLATEAVRGAWSAQDITTNLLKVGQRGGIGTLQTTAANLKTMADAYLVPLSPQVLGKWSERIAAGQSTQEDFDTYLKEQAKILRPWMAKHIDAGLTVKQVGDSFVQLAARELEVDPSQIDLQDPKFARLVDGTVDKDGNRKPMSLADAQTYLRSLDEFKYTKTAHSQVAEIEQAVLTTLGRIA